jgi:aspartyl protease family protein
MVLQPSTPEEFGRFLAAEAEKRQRGTHATAPAPPASASMPAAQGPAPAAPKQRRSVTLAGDRRGMFHVAARVEDKPVRLMVDTGARLVTLTTGDAARLGIRPKPADYTVETRTANGTGRAARVQLGTIQVGEIVVKDVPALVTPGAHVSLLGMSFLSRIRFIHDRGKLVLEQ